MLLKVKGFLNLVGSLSSFVRCEHNHPSAPLVGVNYMDGRGNAQGAEVRPGGQTLPRKPRDNVAFKKLNRLVGDKALLWPEFGHSLTVTLEKSGYASPRGC